MMADIVKSSVIDSSVALKQQLRDEDNTIEADILLNDYAQGKIRLIVPSLFEYEVSNVLRTAVMKGRITETFAYAALSNLNNLLLAKYEFSSIQQIAMNIAFKYQRSVYDSAYLALAQSEGISFVTGDRRLYNAVSHALPWVIWIGDYTLDELT